MANVTVSFSLDTERDKAIIAWLDSLDHGYKSRQIRDVLQGHIEGRGVTIADVYDVARRIEGLIRRGATLHIEGGPGDALGDDAPGTEEAAANLGAWE